MKRAPPRPPWTASMYCAPATDATRCRAHMLRMLPLHQRARGAGSAPDRVLRQRQIRRSRQDTALRMCPGSFTVVLRLCDVDPQPPQLRLLDIPAAAGFFVGLEVVAVPV